MFEASVVIPVKNREKTVLRAIESVKNQRDVHLQIIVVDDGSTDNTVKNIQKQHPQIVIVHNKISQGAAKARNKGATMAKFDYICFLDSDDTWESDHITKSISFIIDNNCDGSFSQFNNIIGANFQAINFDKDKTLNILENILNETTFDCRTSTFVFKKEAFLDIKFDESLKKYQDWDIAFRFSKKYTFCLNRVNTVNLFMEEENRMSNSNNIEALKYFFNKHSNSISDNSKLIFLVKSLKYLQSNQLREKEIVRQLIRKIDSNLLNGRNKIIFFLVSYKILSPYHIYKLFKIYHSIYSI